MNQKEIKEAGLLKFGPGMYRFLGNDGEVYTILRGTPGKYNQPWTVQDIRGREVSRHFTLRDARESL
jgi:hypothetical protein